jgi:ssDNA thymidine ADP-ribosyltransferase, DarT
VEGETPAYHITHVENLASIAACGQLDCDIGCAQAKHNPIGIAHANLKEQRARVEVTVAAGGTLADYVPFYYAPRSPMLCAIAYGNVAGYTGTQEEIVHLACSVQALAEPGRFAVINRHPITALAEQFDDLSALDDLDWAIMREKYWRDTDEDGDRKFRRQAEFLVHQSVPTGAIRLVGAMTEEVARRAARLLAAMAAPPPVNVRKDWYY